MLSTTQGGRERMRITRIAIVLLLGILLVSGIACEGGGESEPTPTPTPAPTPVSGFLTYTDEANGFSISYPEDWELVPEEMWEDVLLMLWAPVACEEFITDFSITTEGLPYPLSVQSYSEGAERHLRSLEGYTSISEEELTVDGKAAIKHVFTFIMEGETFKVMQVYLVENKTAWVLSFGTVPACWSQYEVIFDNMAGSFQLLD